jgi:PncC family amidohydrolase
MDLEEARDKLAAALAKKNVKVVFAESCTAGLCSATMGQVDGISSHLCGSAVTYRPEAKKQWLGIGSATIEEHTCESAEVAEQMALGVIRKTPEADWAAAVVGHIAEGQDWFAYVSVVGRDGTGARNPVKHFTWVRALVGPTRFERQREAAQIVLESLWQAIQSERDSESK